MRDLPARPVADTIIVTSPKACRPARDDRSSGARCHHDSSKTNAVRITVSDQTGRNKQAAMGLSSKRLDRPSTRPGTFMRPHRQIAGAPYDITRPAPTHGPACSCRQASPRDLSPRRHRGEFACHRQSGSWHTISSGGHCCRWLRSQLWSSCRSRLARSSPAPTACPSSARRPARGREHKIKRSTRRLRVRSPTSTMGQSIRAGPAISWAWAGCCSRSTPASMPGPRAALARPTLRATNPTVRAGMPVLFR